MLIISVLLSISVANAQSNSTKYINKNLQQQAPPVLPSFPVYNANGTIVNMESFKGKKVFVNLWATWCAPCRSEIPSIEKLYEAADTSKVVFVMLSIDKNFDKALKYASKKRLRLPIYYPATSLPPLFQVQGIPATFIFNQKGDLTRAISGDDNYNTAEYKNLLK